MVNPVRSAPFVVAAAGGILVAAALAVGSTRFELTGATVFATGVIWVFVMAIHRSHHDGTSLPTALSRGARDALRFAWYLLP